MNSAELASFEMNKIEVGTACRGKMVLADDTPRSTYQDRPVYFCLLECKAKFESDPLNSCLADQVRVQVD